MWLSLCSHDVGASSLHVDETAGAPISGVPIHAKFSPLENEQRS